MIIFITGFTGCLSPLLSLPRTPPTDNCNRLPHPCVYFFLSVFAFFSYSLSLSARLFRIRERRCREKYNLSTLRSNLGLTVTEMAAPKNSFGFGVVAMLAALIFALSVPAAVHGQTLAPAPAPTSDGSSVDQGIAYLLMLLALVLTYLIHSTDISSTF